MARARGKLQRFNFSKGWNTEANPMTFPENTAQDLENVVLDIDGSIRRRLGVSIKDENQVPYVQGTYAEYGTQAIGFDKWENVNGSGDLNFLVSQVGHYLHFSVEDGTEIDTLNFAPAIITGKAVEAAKATLELASGLGYLFCTGPYTEPFYVTYDADAGTTSLTVIDIEIRDFEGVDDGLAVDDRPGVLTNQHEYNLRNQGWVESFDCAVNGGSDATTDPVEYTKTHLGEYPSNADILYLGKAGSGTDEDDIGRYDPKTMAKNAFGTTPAPKGKFILNAFDQDRDAIVTGATSLTINNRPRAVAFHNGRVFYAGVNATGQSGNIYYSQQLTSIDYAGRCYQQNDPTAEEFNELLATDGGLLKIPDCGNVLRLEEGPQGIVVFASNGVWEISGENGRFAADNLFVRKVSDLGCCSRESVVKADNQFFFWSDAGIVGSQQDQVTGNLNLEVISKTTIQSGYLLIGGPQRQAARGAYMRADKKVVWLYPTNATYNSVDDRFKYNGALILDINLGAFYKYRISDAVGNVAPPYVSGVIESDAVITATTDEGVTENGVQVTANGADVTITVESSATDSNTSTMLLQCVYPVDAVDCGIVYGLFSSKTFKDWVLYDLSGSSYDSFVETGYELGGEAMLDKQPKYVHTYMSQVSKHNKTGNFYNIADNTSQYSEVIVGTDLTQYTSTPKIGDLSEDNPVGFRFNGDGTIAWHLNATSPNRLYEYSLSTPYEVTTMSSTGRSVSSIITDQPEGFWYNSDGTVGYIAYFAFETASYTLSTPYDWTTATLVSTSYDTGGLVNTDTGNPSCTDCGSTTWTSNAAVDPTDTYIIECPFTLSSGGVAWSGFGLQEFQMVEAGSAGTGYFNGNWVSFRDVFEPDDYKSASFYGLGMSPDGTELAVWLTGITGGSRVQIIKLATPYRVSGATINPNNYVLTTHTFSQNYGGPSLEWGANGDFYLCTNNKVYQYYVPS